MPSTAELCETLQELQVSRRFLIASANRQENAARAFIRRAFGWRPDLPEKERAAIAAKAATIFAYFEKAARPATKSARKPIKAPDEITAIESLSGVLSAFASGLRPLRERRVEIEALMIAAVRDLPVAAWRSNAKGLGELGLAVIIGETGDLSNYPNFRHVWKRLGLMPFEGRAGSEWRKKPSEMPEGGWAAMGYSPKRLAQIFGVVTEPLLKHQIVSTKKSETEFGSPKGPYGAIYVARREKTKIAHPDWTLQHAKMDALRIMTKALISDLWSEWTGKQHKSLVIAPDRVAASPSPAIQTVEIAS